jgi:cell division initiation protein
MKGGPMKITPLEIRKHEFNTTFRGFDKNEVVSFLEMVSDEMEGVVKEIYDLKEKLSLAQERISSYAKIETALQNTLVASQETAEQMKNVAKEKSELMLRRATDEGDRIIKEAYEKVSELRQEYSSLKSQKASFLVNFRSLLESEQKLLELMEKQAEQDDKTIVIKKKPELSDSDVDRVVEEFKRNINNPIDVPSSVENRLRPGIPKDSKEQ